VYLVQKSGRKVDKLIVAKNEFWEASCTWSILTIKNIEGTVGF